MATPPSSNNSPSHSRVRTRSSRTSNPDDPPPFRYSFVILLSLFNLIGSIPMFGALIVFRIEIGLKDITGLVFWFTAYVSGLVISPTFAIFVSYFRLRRLLKTFVVYVTCAMTLATVAVLVFLGNASVGPRDPEALPARINHDVTYFSSWLREQVLDDEEHHGNELWSKVKMDLVNDKVCHVDDLGSRRAELLPPVFVGCCINSCEIEGYYDDDYKYNVSCVAWDGEDPRKLCYDCDQCKAAVMGEMNFRLALAVPMAIHTLVVHVFTTVVVFLVSIFFI